MLALKNSFPEAILEVAPIYSPVTPRLKAFKSGTLFLIAISKAIALNFSDNVCTEMLKLLIVKTFEIVIRHEFV